MNMFRLKKSAKLIWALRVTSHLSGPWVLKGYGHPNVITLGVAYAFTLQDIVIGASEYVLSAVTS